MTTATVSAIEAGAVRMSVAAHNVANMSTEGFRSLRVIQTEQITGQGVKTEVVRSESGIDLVNELVQEKLALRYMQANGRVFGVQSDLLGSLINELA